MQYVSRNNRNIAFRGWITIDGVQHYVDNYTVVCNEILNQRAWNITEPTSTCKECKAKANIEMDVEQLKLF